MRYKLVYLLGFIIILSNITALSQTLFNLGCVSENNCLYVDRDSIRIYPSGKRSVEAGAIDPVTETGTRMDYLIDCHNGTMLRYDESVAHPARVGTVLEQLYKYICTYNPKTKTSAVHPIQVPVHSAQVETRVTSKQYSCKPSSNEQVKIDINQDRFTGYSYAYTSKNRVCFVKSNFLDHTENWGYEGAKIRITYPLTSDLFSFHHLPEDFTGNDIGSVLFSSTSLSFTLTFYERQDLMSKTYCGVGLSLPKKIIYNKKTQTCQSYR
jgi:hypothetical protein